MSARDRIEKWFEAYGAFMCRYSTLCIVLCLIVAAALTVGMRYLVIDTSFESYLPENNPKKELYNEFRQQFGSGERVILLLEPPDIYDLEFLNQLRSLHHALEEELPYVDEVTSLINVRHTYGTVDSLVSVDLMEEWPDSDEAIAVLKSRVAENPLYRNWILSSDGKMAAIIVELDGSLDAGSQYDEALNFGDETSTSDTFGESGELLNTVQSRELVNALNSVLDGHDIHDTEIAVAGMPIVALELGDMLTQDLERFMLLSVLCIGLLLYVLYRTLAGVVLPLLVVVLAAFSTLGAMGWIGMPLTGVTQILPSLLLAIGIGDAVHVMTMFYRHFNQGYSREESIEYALGHSGLAILMTSVTTAVSMATFNITELQPTIDLGRAAPFGVFMAFFFSVVLLPALLAVLPISQQKLLVKQGSGTKIFDHILTSFGRFGFSYPKFVVGVTLALWVVSIVGITRLYFSQDDLNWLPDGNSTRVASKLINERMGGGEPIEFLIDSGEERGLLDPLMLQTLDDMQTYAESVQVGPVSVGQSFSLADIVKETNKALNASEPAYYTIPDDARLIKQELFLFESTGSDDLEDVKDSSSQVARMMFTVPFVDALYYPKFAAQLVAGFNDILAERALQDKVTITVTGFMTIAGETFNLLFISMARSYSLAFLLVAILLVLLIGELRLGLVSLIPNLTPIVVVLGAMGLLGIPLDISSMLLGGILIGIAVDDTIHFAHNFNRYHRETGCPEKAITLTLQTAGRAMLVTSLVLVVGFFILTAASLNNIILFGWICGFGVMLAFLADVIVMPSLVALVDPCSGRNQS